MLSIKAYVFVPFLGCCITGCGYFQPFHRMTKQATATPIQVRIKMNQPTTELTPAVGDSKLSCNSLSPQIAAITHANGTPISARYSKKSKNARITSSPSLNRGAAHDATYAM